MYPFLLYVFYSYEIFVIYKYFFSICNNLDLEFRLLFKNIIVNTTLELNT